jgi:hypothetical protein
MHRRFWRLSVSPTAGQFLSLRMLVEAVEANSEDAVVDGLSGAFVGSAQVRHDVEKIGGWLGRVSLPTADVADVDGQRKLAEGARIAWRRGRNELEELPDVCWLLPGQRGGR